MISLAVHKNKQTSKNQKLPFFTKSSMKNNGGRSDVYSPFFTSKSLRFSVPFTTITQNCPKDRLNMSPYFIRISRNVSRTCPLAILCIFPMTGIVVGPGGHPVGLLDRIHRIIIRRKANNIKKSKTPRSTMIS
jgi:hypothetical protein